MNLQRHQIPLYFMLVILAGHLIACGGNQSTGEVGSQYSTLDLTKYPIPEITQVAASQSNIDVTHTWSTTDYDRIESLECETKPENGGTWTAYPHNTTVPFEDINCSHQGPPGTGNYVFRIKVKYVDGIELTSNVSDPVVAWLPIPTNFDVTDIGTDLKLTWNYANYGTSNTGFIISYTVYFSNWDEDGGSYTINNSSTRSYIENPCNVFTDVVSIKFYIKALGDVAGDVEPSAWSSPITTTCP